jgi:hypothetical protein
VEPFADIKGLDRHEGSFVEALDSDYLREFIAANYQSADVDLRMFFLSTNIGEWCEVVALRYEAN